MRQRLLRLASCESLLKCLLAQSCDVLTGSSLLTKQLLGKCCLLLRSLRALSKQCLSRSLLLLGSGRALTEELLRKSGLSLPGAQLLAIQLLRESSLLLCRSKSLTESSLSDAKQLRCSGLLSGTIGLLGSESQLLLLLSRRKGLPVAGLHDVRQCFALRQRLLLLQVCCCNTRPVTTEGARSYGITQLFCLSLLGLLIQQRSGWCNDVLDIRAHKLPDFCASQSARHHRTTTSQTKLCGQLLVWLRTRLCSGKICRRSLRHRRGNCRRGTDGL